MQRLINTVGTAAASVVLMAGLWQDWSLLTTLKRMLISYLGFFFLGSLMVLVIKMVPLFDKSLESSDLPEEETKKREKTLA